MARLLLKHYDETGAKQSVQPVGVSGLLALGKRSWAEVVASVPRSEISDLSRLMGPAKIDSAAEVSEISHGGPQRVRASGTMSFASEKSNMEEKPSSTSPHSEPLCEHQFLQHVGPDGTLSTVRKQPVRCRCSFPVDFVTTS